MELQNPDYAVCFGYAHVTCDVWIGDTHIFDSIAALPALDVNFLANPQQVVGVPNVSEGDAVDGNHNFIIDLFSFQQQIL